MKNYFIASIDFDGVLALGYKAKIKYAKEWFNVDLNLEQTKKEGFNAFMKSLDKKINYRDLMDRLNEEHIFEFGIPTYCKDVLAKCFAENFRFVIITSRNAHDFPYAAAFIKENFPFIKYMQNTNNLPKDIYAKRLKPRVHIDDDLKKLLEIKHLPIELIYFRQPENSGQEIPLSEINRIIEAIDWKDIGILLEKIKKDHEEIAKELNIKNNVFNIKAIFDYYHSK